MIPDNLFILEMANNHMGSVEHGIRIIKEFEVICKKLPPYFTFAFKLQYRNLSTFIHPEGTGKYVQRFKETSLSREDFDKLVETIKDNGFLSIATPFDEQSVDVIEEQDLDIIKIASCSLGDWPLLERVVLTDKPVIFSTAGASLTDIDRVVSFLKNRNKTFAIMHCVGEYPTPKEDMNLNQIDLLKTRYPNIRIGFSTHEPPDNVDLVKIAIAKGATVFEKHVGISTPEWPLNPYSSSPSQTWLWLHAAQLAFIMCGSSQRKENESEIKSILSLRRGVFAKRDIKPGETITDKDVFFAFPPEEGQFCTKDWSKYSTFKANLHIKANIPLMRSNVFREDRGDKIYGIVQKIKTFVSNSGVQIPSGSELEISHHYGLENFYQNGLAMFTIINRSYCKKLLVLLPGQRHPEQYHKKKEETFHVLHGEIMLGLDGKMTTCKAGHVEVIFPGVRHDFLTSSGAIIEEISSTHYKDDSFYTDPDVRKDRKTVVSHWFN